MAEHSPEQDRFQEPDDLSENTQERNPLARAFLKLREGRGRETTSLYQDIVKPQ